MAVTTHAVATGDTANVTSYVTGSFTPAANDLLVGLVSASATVAAGSMTNSAGLGFTKITTALKGTSTDTLYLFVANALAAASAQTCTFDCTGDASTGVVTYICRISGMTLTGSSAVKQSAVTSNMATGTTPNATFAASALTGNPTIGFASGTGAVTPPTSWTELVADTAITLPTLSAEYCTRDSGFTGTTITWGSTITGISGCLIAEFDTSAGTPAARVAGPRISLAAVTRGAVR